MPVVHGRWPRRGDLITNSYFSSLRQTSRKQPLASRDENCFSGRVRNARFWGALMAALLLAPPLSAQEESVHLDYDVSIGCPDRAAFIAEITARTTRARFVDEGANVRTFKATIRVQGERIVGSLMSNTGEAGAERRISGRTCAEVASALGLITALAIDPSASTRASSAASPETPDLTQKATAAAATDTGTKASSASVSVDEKNAIQPPRSSWGLSWHGQGEASYGLTEEGANLAMLGGAIDIEVGPFARERKGPLFRLGMFLMRSPTVSQSDPQPLGEATFTRVGGRLSCSPLALRISGAFELHPWLIVEMGRLNGSGTNGPGDLLTATQDDHVLWLAIGEGIELRGILGERLWLTLDFRATETLNHQTFVFHYLQRRTPITAVPFLEGILGAGVGGPIL